MKARSSAVNLTVYRIASFGTCENAIGQYETVAVDGEAQGITFDASTGDYGYESQQNGSNCASQPAALPDWVAVGGTSPVGGSYASQSGWSGSGGGMSNYSPLQAANVTCGWSQIPSTQRIYPDIAFAADPSDGAALVYNSSYAIIGGTSWAAPIFASMMSEINQQRGSALHYTVAALYEGYCAGRPTFEDVTSGNNGQAAGLGWDFVTGFGSVDGFLTGRTIQDGTSYN